MKVYTAREREIDERLELDKRHDPKGFCRNFSSKEMSDKFYDLQHKIRDGLEEKFRANFDDAVDGSQLQSSEAGASHTLFYFDTDLTGSERIIVEFACEMLSDKLVDLIRSYLEKCQVPYCVIVAVYRGMHKGSEYLGRFVINLEEVAVEESLADIWTKQVHTFEIGKH